MKGRNLLLAGLFLFLGSAGVRAADDVVEFHIAKGTGKNPWNTRETVVEVKVGQTLRLINDDDITHYLHTPGRPCGHGKNPFKAGETYDCVVSGVADPDKDVLYDHQFGPTSRFYVRAIN